MFLVLEHCHLQAIRAHQAAEAGVAKAISGLDSDCQEALRRQSRNREPTALQARECEPHSHGDAANVCRCLVDHPETLSAVDWLVANRLERNARCHAALRTGDRRFGHWPLAWDPPRFARFAAFRLVLESPVTVEALLSG